MISLPIAITVGLILLGLLLGFDVYLAADKVPGNTWSEILRQWGKSTPFIAWFWSVMLGHWFHPESVKPILGQPGSVALLIWLTSLLVVWGLGLSRAGYPIPSWTVIVPGILAGVFLWPVD